MADHHYNRKRVDRWVAEHTIEEKDDTKRKKEQRQFARFYRATVRGFAIGFLLRGGIHSVTALARVAKRQEPGGLWERSLDTARWACAMGCFGGVYVGVDEALRSLVGCHRCATWQHHSYDMEQHEQSLQCTIVLPMCGFTRSSAVIPTLLYLSGTSAQCCARLRRT